MSLAFTNEEDVDDIMQSKPKRSQEEMIALKEEIDRLLRVQNELSKEKNILIDALDKVNKELLTAKVVMDCISKALGN